MKITYKMTWRNWQESYRVGLSHLTLPFCLIYGSVALLIPFGLLLILYGKGYPLTWPPAAPPPRLVLTNTIVLVGVGIGSWLVSTLLFGYLFPSRAVQVLPRCFAWKQFGHVNRVRWKNITNIIETGEHIFFCQNHPIAIIVPKLAFRSQEQANMFLEQAIQHWHEAKGILPPLLPGMPGVWPPAPLPGNSAEPGDTPQC